MELRQLEYFVAVADEANFTRAAERVHISQSGVSAQVRQLERELGQQLLDRSGRTVRLTDVGAAVLPFARMALDAVAGARAAVDELAGLVRGRVTIGMVSGCALPVVGELLAEFHHAHPGVTMSLTEDTSDRLVERLREGRLDLVVIGSAGEVAPELETVLLVDEPLVAVVRPDDPLAHRKGITVDALRDRPLICLPRGTGVRAALDVACAEAGFEPRVVFQASALAMVAHLAGLGLGTAIVPASTAPAGDTTARVLPLRPAARGQLHLAWDPEATSPAARALAEHARAFLQRSDSGMTDRRGWQQPVGGDQMGVVPIAIAHRGDPRNERENTLAAFTAAVGQGADMVELDLRRTRDGTVVVLHDPTLRRLWGVDRPVAELDLAEVQAVGSSEHIPTLEQVVGRITVPLMVDFTGGDVVEGSVAVLRRAGAMARSLFVSGNVDALRRLRSVAPEARIGLTWVRTELPTTSLLDELGVDFWNPRFPLATPDCVAAMHDIGLQVSTWTVDGRRAMARALHSGVDAIVTNRIARLRRALAR